ncbi:hypothetical protein CDL15_Pgr024333 [Punica granatum]|uniref:DUF569 domain-containing protein n=1 Tax=Punica granatum TaxID=22663 RepID=A0A218XWR4_PUNGR|nr:hypothetical protein CDL15_Pgr024333 [Punica granatum]
MEFFNKANPFKLRSHLEKYLVADEEDREKVRQSRRSADSRNALWFAEPVPGGHTIRLRSCHGRYLTASDAPFLLGMTGKKVILTEPGTSLDLDPSLEWEPMRDGFQVRLRTGVGKYLRANGGTPPWRNSITHDDPHSSATQNWVLWDVEAVKPNHGGSDSSASFQQYLSAVSSFSSVPEDILRVLGLETEWPKEIISRNPPSKYSSDQLPASGAMEMFGKVKVVRLRSLHGKYLVADEDRMTVGQERDGASGKARWLVEFVLNSDSIIRLRSCHGRYLTASNSPFRLGVAGHKVLQTLPKRLDSSLEWEPVKEGNRIKLKTRYGNFLRANTSGPPWGGSVTHDIPRRSSTQNWVLWDVEVVEQQAHSVDDEPLVTMGPPARFDSVASSLSNLNSRNHEKSPPILYREESIDSGISLSPKMEGRVVYYHIADENGEVLGEEMQGFTLNFNGKCVKELTRKLEEETGIVRPIVCFRSPLNGKLCPLRLQLPPNIAMRVVLVPSSSFAG